MTVRSGADLLVAIIGGYDLRPTLRGVSTFKREKTLAESSVFGINDKTQASAQLRKAALGLQGFYDDAALQSAIAANALFGDTVTQGMLGMDGNALGRLCTMFSGVLEASFPRVVKVGDLSHVDSEWAVSGPGVSGQYAVDEGVLLVPFGAITSAAAQPSYDQGAPSTNGMVAYLFATALTLGGYTSWTVEIQDSANNSAFSTIATFSPVITAVPYAAVPIRVAGTIRQYVRANITLQGAGSSPSVTLVVGIAFSPTGVGLITPFLGLTDGDAPDNGDVPPADGVPAPDEQTDPGSMDGDGPPEPPEAVPASARRHKLVANA